MRHFTSLVLLTALAPALQAGTKVTFRDEEDVIDPRPRGGEAPAGLQRRLERRRITGKEAAPLLAFFVRVA